MGKILNHTLEPISLNVTNPTHSHQGFAPELLLLLLHKRHVLKWESSLPFPAVSCYVFLHFLYRKAPISSQNKSMQHPPQPTESTNTHTHSHPLKVNLSQIHHRNFQTPNIHVRCPIPARTRITFTHLYCR